MVSQEQTVGLDFLKRFVNTIASQVSTERIETASASYMKKHNGVIDEGVWKLFSLWPPLKDTPLGKHLSEKFLVETADESDVKAIEYVFQNFLVHLNGFLSAMPILFLYSDITGTWMPFVDGSQMSDMRTVCEKTNVYYGLLFGTFLTYVTFPANSPTDTNLQFDFSTELYKPSPVVETDENALQVFLRSKLIADPCYTSKVDFRANSIGLLKLCVEMVSDKSLPDSLTSAHAVLDSLKTIMQNYYDGCEVAAVKITPELKYQIEAFMALDYCPITKLLYEHKVAIEALHHTQEFAKRLQSSLAKLTDFVRGAEFNGGTDDIEPTKKKFKQALDEANTLIAFKLP